MRKTYIILLILNFARANHDVLLEFKGAYFLSTSTTFKNTYGTGGALYGPEVTFKLYKSLYGWLSIDFFTKHGRTLENKALAYANVSTISQVIRCDGYRTKLLFMPIAAGFKYFLPFCHGSGRLAGDFYLGLGITPTYLRTKQGPAPQPVRRSLGVGGSSCMSAGGVGGVAKIGSYVNLPRNFIIDLFFDYSFAWAIRRRSSSYGGTGTNLSGCVFGLGVGYRFN